MGRMQQDDRAIVTQVEQKIGHKLKQSATYDKQGQLIALNLSRLELSQVPAELGQLTSLQQLDLSYTQLAAIPAELGQLTSLQTLSLDYTQLAAIPAELSQLSHLIRLDLNHTQLAAIPAELGQLTFLQTLRLDHTQLTAIPIELGQLTSLQTLSLENTSSLLTPPSEIVQQGTQALLAFLRELQHSSVKRYEAKLLFVGEGGTGKSSLLRALHGKDFVPTLDTTHGIEVDALLLSHPTLPAQNITLHTWDFGGQDIYRATHQFFLTKRSLYLVVWNARIEPAQSNLDYWLKTIGILAPDARVLLVATHIDERDPDLDEQQYRKAYPHIVDVLHVSSKDGKGIDLLKRALAPHSAHLPLMGQPWPHSWIEVEQALLSSLKHLSKQKNI